MIYVAGKRFITGAFYVSLLYGVNGLSCFDSPAWAETPGEKVIRLMDEAMTQAKDQYFEYEVNVLEPGKPQRQMVMEVYIQGTQRRRVDFRYVYLPAYHKIRRVASHVRSQGFMGTSFSHDDMSIVTYGPVFNGELVSETLSEWKVKATRRSGQDFPYPRLDFTISKKHRQPTQIQYFNDKGTKLKTETRTEYTCKGTICYPILIKMVDHTRNNHATELRSRKWKVNQNLSDSFFSRRSLQKER